MIQDDTLPDYLKNALTNIINRPLPRIQEADFVRFFLNGFAGEIDNVPLINWLDVAGNAMSAVEVCNGEEVLFVVPPLLGDVNIKPGTSRGDTMGEIVARAQKLNRIHPRQGEDFLKQALSERIHTTDKDYAVIAQWNTIFERYGKPKIKLPHEIAAEAAKQENNNGKPPIVDFEEL